MAIYAAQITDIVPLNVTLPAVPLWYWANHPSGVAEFNGLGVDIAMSTLPLSVFAPPPRTLLPAGQLTANVRLPPATRAELPVDAKSV
jgi:hypothetical protein